MTNCHHSILRHLSDYDLSCHKTLVIAFVDLTDDSSNQLLLLHDAVEEKEQSVAANVGTDESHGEDGGCDYTMIGEGGEDEERLTADR